ncbi:MAG TPA: hypothetical protein VKA30_07505 [Actinomycetota bacterium]|nr:hypothetical protein [Actinomycetota bacterium]
MWLWISIGSIGYLAIVGLFLVLGAAARVGDRTEGAVFARWVEGQRRRVVEHPALRQSRRPKAA